MSPGTKLCSDSKILAQIGLTVLPPPWTAIQGGDLVDDPDPDMGFKNRHFETYKGTETTEIRTWGSDLRFALIFVFFGAFVVKNVSL